MRGGWNRGLVLVPRIDRLCQFCGQVFATTPYRNLRFCSKLCRNRYGLSLVKQPWNKGKPWSEAMRAKLSAKAQGRRWKQESREKVSQTIRRLYAEGKMTHADFSLDKNPNWQGGRKYFPYHPSFNYKLRRLVRARDNYTCVICGKIGKQVHHIDNDKENPNPRLITLCNRCHTTAERNPAKYRPILNELWSARVCVS